MDTFGIILSTYIATLEIMRVNTAHYDAAIEYYKESHEAYAKQEQLLKDILKTLTERNS